MTTLDVMTAELETARKIFWLLRNDHIFLTNYNDDKDDWDEGAYPAINCNDIFVPGADAEKLDAEDLDKYVEVVKKWPQVGAYAWCAVKRSANPWRLIKDGDWLLDYNNAIIDVKAILGVRE